MRPTLVVGSGPSLFVTGGDSGRTRGPYPIDPDPRRAATKLDVLAPADLPVRLVQLLESTPIDSALTATPSALAAAIRAATHRPVGTPSLDELRRARATLPEPEPLAERRFVLALGRARLERALRAPEEVLITLAREEERVERALGREARATDSLLVVPDSPFELHLSARSRARAALEELAEALRRSVEAQARELAPNLSAVVGPRVAARLVSAAGGLAPLARMPSARIQLLGSRRRPSPERGPRFGVLYRAERMGDVPLGRRGAYARSLAALAAIAVRVDATTHRVIAADLVRRRDRRVDGLRRRSA